MHQNDKNSTVYGKRHKKALFLTMSKGHPPNTENFKKNHKTVATDHINTLPLEKNGFVPPTRSSAH